jgi:hypothetical protein
MKTTEKKRFQPRTLAGTARESFPGLGEAKLINWPRGGGERR